MTPSLLATSLVLALGQTPESVSAKDSPPDDAFLQARLSFLAGDTDFNAPDATTRVHVALDARTAELTSGLRAEAGLSLFLNPNNLQGITLQDNSSFFRLRYRPSAWASTESLTLTAFPVSSTRLYMGFENPVVWGRQSTLSRRGEGGDPGLELALSRQRWDAFVAAKLPRLRNGVTSEWERKPMFLAGVGVNLTQAFRAEIKAATMDQGTAINSPYLRHGRNIYTRGVSGRMQWRHGVPVGTNVDLALYEGDPTFFERFFSPDIYPGGFGASISLEGSFVSQQLLYTETVETAETRKETGQAAALVARFKWDLLRLHAIAYYKTPEYLLTDVPGLPGEQAMYDHMERTAETSATVSADYHLRDWGLTPGLLVRITTPATLTTPFARPLGYPDGRLIVHGGFRFTSIPEGAEARPVLTAKATARWDIGEVAGVLAEFFYTRDPNRPLREEDDQGAPRIVIDSPNMVGANLMLQVRL